MRKKFIIVMILLICITLSSCSYLSENTEDYLKNKEECILNENNIREFTYNSKTYTILDEKVDENDLNKLVGYIRKLVIINENGEILKEEDARKISIDNLTNFVEDIDENAYTLQFFDVYMINGLKEELAVEVNGRFHKAIYSDNVNSETKEFNFLKEKDLKDKSFKINAENATQLICNGVIYQVTSEEISEEELENFIDIIGENIVLDRNTKKQLSKKELNKIDWFGKDQSDREEIFYLDIYSISGVDIDEEVAIKVNGRYLKAVKID